VLPRLDLIGLLWRLPVRTPVLLFERAPSRIGEERRERRAHELGAVAPPPLRLPIDGGKQPFIHQDLYGFHHDNYVCAEPTGQVRGCISPCVPYNSLGDDGACLRAAHGGQSQRTYTVTLEAKDASGNASQASISVIVPKKKTPGCDVPASVFVSEGDPRCAF
jgi:hypothetical protein